MLTTAFKTNHSLEILHAAIAHYHIHEPDPEVTQTFQTYWPSRVTHETDSWGDNAFDTSA